MTAITALPTPPNTLRPTTFAAESDAFLGALPTFVTEANALAAAMTAVAAGGAVSLQYTFSTTTTDSDPGAGILRLSSATQNTSTVIRTDLLGSDGSTLTGVLDLLDDSTSTNKGYITLRKSTDATKWLVFSVASLASPSGYRNVTVTCVASSAANPFADTDALLLDFTPNGDAGSTGATGNSAGLAYAFSSTTSAADPGAGILRLNHATIASATALYISETDANAANLAAEIASWDDASATNKAKLRISKLGDQSKFAIFNVTGTNTDGGAWDTVNLSYVTGAGTLADTDSVRIEVVRNGDTGAAGAAGVGLPTNIVAHASLIELTSTPTLAVITPTGYGAIVKFQDATSDTPREGYHATDNKGPCPVRALDSAGALKGIIPAFTKSTAGLQTAGATGVWSLSNVDAYGVTAQLLTTTLVQYILAIDLGSGRQMILANGPSNVNQYAAIYDKLTNTWGAVTLIRTGTLGASIPTAILCAADKVLAVSCITTAFEAVVLTANGDLTITVGTPDTETLSPGNINNFAVGCGILACGSSWVTVFKQGASTITMFAITVSGTTPTIGTATGMSGSANPVVVISGSIAIVASDDSGTNLFVNPYTITGTGIAIGTGASIVANRVVKHFAPIGAYWYLGHNNGTGTGAYASIVTLASTTVTLSTVTMFAAGNTLDAIIVDAETVCMVNNQSTSNCNILTNTAGTAGVGTAITLSSDTARSCRYMDGTDVYIAHGGTGNIELNRVDCSGTSPVRTEKFNYGFDSTGASGVFYSPTSNEILQRPASLLYGTKFCLAVGSTTVNSALLGVRGNKPFVLPQQRLNRTGGSGVNSYRGVVPSEVWVSDHLSVITKLECIP